MICYIAILIVDLLYCFAKKPFFLSFFLFRLQFPTTHTTLTIRTTTNNTIIWEAQNSESLQRSEYIAIPNVLE